MGVEVRRKVIPASGSNGLQLVIGQTVPVTADGTDEPDITIKVVLSHCVMYCSYKYSEKYCPKQAVPQNGLFLINGHFCKTRYRDNNTDVYFRRLVLT